MADRPTTLEDVPGNVNAAEGGFEKETLDALDSVYRFALHLTQDPSDCDDLVQDTFLRAYRSRHQYRLGTNCAAWLFTICHNLWIQKRQRERRITTWGRRTSMRSPRLGDSKAGRSICRSGGFWSCRNSMRS